MFANLVCFTEIISSNHCRLIYKVEQGYKLKLVTSTGILVSKNKIAENWYFVFIANMALLCFNQTFII